MEHDTGAILNDPNVENLISQLIQVLVAAADERNIGVEEIVFATGVALRGFSHVAADNLSMEQVKLWEGFEQVLEAAFSTRIVQAHQDLPPGVFNVHKVRSKDSLN